MLTLSATLHAANSVQRTTSWAPEKQNDFEKLQMKLTSRPVLVFLDFKESFVVEPDASSVAVGTVMARRKEHSKVVLVQYASGTVNDAEKKY